MPLRLKIAWMRSGQPGGEAVRACADETCGSAKACSLSFGLHPARGFTRAPPCASHLTLHHGLSTYGVQNRTLAIMERSATFSRGGHSCNVRPTEFSPPMPAACRARSTRSEEHTSELQSQSNLVC